MTFNDDAQLDLSRTSGGGGGGFGRGGMVVGGGGGVLGIIAVILYMLFGGGGTEQGGGLPQDPSNYNATRVGGAGQVDSSVFSDCKTGADANRKDACLVIATENSLYDYWTRTLPASTKNKQPLAAPGLVNYQGQTQSACGTASNQVGPFYCPLDKKMYIDANFFNLLSKRFGADGGQFAKEYVVAHEYGHAIQDQLGVLDAAQKDPQGPASGGVRTELMADCFAGMWAKDATTTKDKNGTTLLKGLSQQDIKSALSAASAVGDDTIQQKTSGRVTPENFTHGTAEQRMRWFMTGFQSQNINSCNTLRASQL